MNPTQLAGIAAFSLAALSCLAVREKPWSGLAVLHGVFLAEVLVGFRHISHSLVARALGDAYAGRGPYQEALLAGLFLIALLGTLLILRRPERGAARGALLVSAALCVLFGIETISLHAADAILYRQVAGIMVVGWSWLLAGGAVAFFAWRFRSIKRSLE